MMTIDEIKAALEDRKLSVVAEKTGLHYNVLYSLVSGRVKSPSYETVRRIQKYLDGARTDD